MASARISTLKTAPASDTKLLDDRRFRALLSDEDWGRLPVAIWRRFSTRVEDGKLWATDATGGTAEVTIADVIQSNGVIHVVDGVLLPA